MSVCSYKFTTTDGEQVKIQGKFAMMAWLVQNGAEKIGRPGAANDARRSAPRQTDTDEFKRWFGNSKMRDDNGDPKVYYHATRGDLSVLKPGGLDPTISGPAIWLSPYAEKQPAMHNVGARGGGYREGANVMPLYVRMERPLMLDDKDMLDWARAAFADDSREFPQLMSPKWVKALKEDGYDGIMFNPSTIYNREGQDEAIVFDSSQIKSAIGNDGSFNPASPDIRRSAARPQFYSQLQRAIEAVPDRLATMAAPAWQQWLKANAPKLGIKADEIAWSGIEDYLKLQGKTKVNKADLAAFLGENGVNVGETVLGVPAFVRADEAKAYLADRYGITVEELEEGRGYESDSDYIGQANEVRDDARDTSKYGSYKVPGGENYREVLVTLPGQREGLLAKKLAMESRGALLQGNPNYATDRAEYDAINEKLMAAKEFKSKHWDDPNVLVHFRADDRTDVDGNRVLFLHDLQSDWGQDGKKYGLDDGNAPTKLVGDNERVDLMKRMRDTVKDKLVRNGVDEAQARIMVVNMGHGILVSASGFTAEMADLEERERQDRVAQQSYAKRVPAAPFITDTKAWVALGLKRALMVAVEAGQDRVAVVNGEQAAEMFDLSKSVESVEYRQRQDGPKAGTGLLTAYDHSGNQIINKPDARPEDLPDIIGKEAADRLLQSEGPGYMGSDDKAFVLSGEDLKVGGEGMKAFYDQIVPQVMRDVAKKLGGRVVEVSVETPGSGPGEVDRSTGVVLGPNAAKNPVKLSRQAAIEITPEMRDKVAAGVPLFSRARGVKEERYTEDVLGDQVTAPTLAPADDGEYATTTALVTTRKQKIGAKKVSSPSDAAQALAYLNKSAVERFDALLTDAKGKPLSIIGGFKGALARTAVYPATLLGEAIMVPKAANIWFVHNHPSGTSTLSDADLRLFGSLAETFEGTGIKPQAILAVTDSSWSSSAGGYQRDSGFIDTDREPGATVPVQEREIVQNGLLATAIDGPAAAVRSAQMLSARNGNRSGLMLMNSQYQPTAYVPWAADGTETLKADGRLPGLLRALSKANAAAAILVNPHQEFTVSAYRNLATALKRADVRMLDVLSGPASKSAAQQGLDYTEPRDVLFSRARNPQEDTPEFKAWFGDSKVVDAEGKPLVVYRGESGGADFNTFDRDAIRENAFFFTADKRIAQIYANGGEPRAFYLKADKFLDLTEGEDGENFIIEWAKAWDEWVDRGSGEEIDPVDFVQGGRLFDYEGDWSAERWKDLQASIEFAGYDGAKLPDWDNGIGLFGAIVVFSPAQIKSATGNDGSFDPTNPDIRRSTARAWDAPGAAKWDDLVYKLQDKQVDLKRVTEAIKTASGAIADDLDVYLREEMYHGRAAKKTKDFVDDELAAVMEDMKATGLDVEDLDAFLYARHAKEANALIADRNPNMPTGGSGMSDAEADKYLASLAPAERAKLDRVAAKVDSIIKGTRELLVDADLESRAAVDSWGQMFQHYVPLMREDDGSGGGMGTGQGFSIKGRETKSRTGSTTRKVVDILANVAMQRERAIVRAEKNRVAQALVGLAEANPNRDFWTVDQVPSTMVYDQKRNLVVERPDNLFKQRDNVVVAKVPDGRGGVTERAVIFDERDERAMRMAGSIKNLDAAQLEGLLGASAKVSRYFAAINTQWNPVFGIVNLMRDVQGALINLGTTELANDRVKVARSTLPALRGIYKAIRGDKTGPWAQLWEEFQNVGGQTGYRDQFANSGDRAEKIRDELDPTRWTQSKWGKIFTAGGVLKVPLTQAQRVAAPLFKWLGDYNDSMENGVRLAAYKAGLERGLTKERAASIAKNLTVNFNRKGQAAQQVGALYAFFNAAMQGTARLGSVLIEMEPGKPKTMRLSKLGQRVVAGGMLLGTMQALAMSMAGFGDDDPPDFVRERNLIIPTGDKKYLAIPMPLGLHVIPNVARITTEWALGGFEKTPQRLGSILGSFADAFNPIGNSGMSIQTLAPTAIDPLVALSENKDFTGRSIAKESRNPATPGHELRKDTATSASIWLSEAINTLTGGNEYVAGVFSPTPDQIDYLAGQVGGGVWRELSKVDQTVRSVISGEELPTNKIPLLGRLGGNAASQQSQGNIFRGNTESLNELETEIKGLRGDNRHAEAQALIRSRPDAYLIAQANAAENQVQRLRRQKSELIRQGADKEKVAEIEKRITETMGRFNRSMEEFRARQPA